MSRHSSYISSIIRKAVFLSRRFCPNALKPIGRQIELQLQARVIVKNEKIVREKAVINVLFIAVNPAFWKMDSLMKAMMAHPRFNPRILVAPLQNLVSSQARRAQMDETRRFLEERGFPVIELCDEEGKGTETCIPKEYDILFYPQPYKGLVPKWLDYPAHRDRLWGYVPYAFHTSTRDIFYNYPYMRFAWIDCYENEDCATTTFQLKQPSYDNAAVTGLPVSDDFLFPEHPHISPWKPQPGPVKKVIWAPHWTIIPGCMLYLSHFLEMAEQMSELAARTVGSIQWAFKPHPMLYNTLCRHPEWGKERADSYYARWADGENTQLEKDAYTALFMHSDAMVHDCCSFSTDYHFTGKPALFLARDLQTYLADGNAMGREAVEAQYIGKNMEDVERFISDTVLGGHDPMQQHRSTFRDQYLVPPHGRSAAENIINYILTGNIDARP